MLNTTTLRPPLPLLLSPPLPPPPSLPPPPHHHGSHPGLMFIGHAFPCISFLLLLLHLISTLLIKLLSFLHHRRATFKSSDSADIPFFCRDDELCIPCREDSFVTAAATPDELNWKQDIFSDAVHEEEPLLFSFTGSHENDSLLADEGIGFEEQIFLAKDDAFPHGCSVDCLLSPVNASHHVAFNVDHSIEGRSINGDEKKDLTDDEKLENLDFDSKSSKVEEAAHRDKVTFCGSLAGESTSDSSIEWRSSTIFRDSETEYPFSSSSRRSSSNWESYTLFRKYEEEMVFFDKISAQKLAETESFRSKNAKRRSIPKRIISKLMAKPKNVSMWDPYQDLESAYVAQVCLAWEVLNWNYSSFRRANGNGDMEGSCCQAIIAQRFQQFQVLLQRFIENEPFEYGQRPEIFARTRLSSPKLLQVPEFLCEEENQKELDAKISPAEFLSILEDAIRTFMNFLKADKRRLKVFVKRKQSAADLTYLRLLKKINKKKKLKLEEIGRRGKYWRKRKTKEEEEMEALMTMIDLKVVSRVLRVQQITEEQLHWCEDKMSKVRVWDGKMKRDQYSPLFFPVHS